MNDDSRDDNDEEEEEESNNDDYMEEDGVEIDSSEIMNRAKDLSLLDIDKDEKESKCFEALVWFKNISSMSNVPVDTIIGAGVIPVLIHLLSLENYPSYQKQSGWTISNLLTGTTDQTIKLIDIGCIQALINALSSASPDVCEYGLMGLGNIAGDNVLLRDRLLNMGVLPMVFVAANKHENINLIKSAGWTVLNLIEGDPSPDIEILKQIIPYIESNAAYALDAEVLEISMKCLKLLLKNNQVFIEHFIQLPILKVLMNLIYHPNKDIHDPILDCMEIFITSNEKNCGILLEIGLLDALQSILIDRNLTNRSTSISLALAIVSRYPCYIQSMIDTNLLYVLVKEPGLKHQRYHDDVCEFVEIICLKGSEKQIIYLVSIGSLRPLYQNIKNLNETSKSNRLQALDRAYQICESNGLEGVFLRDAEDGKLLLALKGLLTDKNENVCKTASRLLDSFFFVSFHNNEHENVTLLKDIKNYHSQDTLKIENR